MNLFKAERMFQILNILALQGKHSGMVSEGGKNV